MELGCTVYNPNTDNVEICKAISKALSTKEEVNPDGRWLLTFNENVVDVAKTKGFILQIQQGTTHQKSDMQKAEEMMTEWKNVPRIAVWAFDTDNARHLAGGGTLAKQYMETALAKAEEQWTKGIQAEVQMCSERYEPVDGAKEVPTDSKGHIHGMAKCTWPDGGVYVGQWQHGNSHGHGTYNYADGAVYVGQFQHNKRHGQGTYTAATGNAYMGQFQHDKRHGQGKYTFADGNFVLGFWVDGKQSGESVQFSKDRQKAWLLKDGKKARELSPSEAVKKVEELGLSKLLK